MPYTKSIVAGIILFALIFPVLGSFPYKGVKISSDFTLTVPKFVQPLQESLSGQVTPAATYGQTIVTYSYGPGDSIRNPFNGYGGINGTVQNTGDYPIYIGVTDLNSYDTRKSAYSNATFAGNIDPLTELTSVSKTVYLLPGETKDVSLPLVHNTTDIVIRILPNPTNPGQTSYNLNVNIRNYMPLYQYMTKIVFMNDYTVENFTITVNTKTQGEFVVYIGITPANNFDERSKLYGNVQYRQYSAVKDALTVLGMHYSSRSKLIVRTGFGNMPEVSKGYYILRTVSFYTNDIDLAVTMTSYRQNVSMRVRMRVIVVLLISLYLPFKFRHEIEYILRK